jgi:hypothetical protein
MNNCVIMNTMSDTTQNHEKIAKISYDIATAFRVAPWILVMGDKRSPDFLVEVALRESKSFIDALQTDDEASRLSLIRGLLLNLCNCLGLRIDTRLLDMIAVLTVKHVDGSA